MASNTQENENAEDLLMLFDTDVDNELFELNDSIDDSHLLTSTEPQSKNETQVTSDQEKEIQVTTTNLKPNFQSSVLSQDAAPYNSHPTPETIMDEALKRNVASGYLHNVSPVKNGNYFDFQLQMKHKTSRGVYFSPPTHKNFSEYSKCNNPVEIKKV